MFFHVARFHRKNGHLVFHGTRQGTYQFKTGCSNVVKICTHRIYVIRVILVMLNNTFLIIFCVKNTTTIEQHFTFCGGWVVLIML